MADIDAIIWRHAERAIAKALSERGLRAPGRPKRIPASEPPTPATADKPVRAKLPGKKKARRAAAKQKTAAPERKRATRKNARVEPKRPAKRKRAKVKQPPEQLTLF